MRQQKPAFHRCVKGEFELSDRPEGEREGEGEGEGERERGAQLANGESPACQRREVNVSQRKGREPGILIAERL